MAPAVTEYGLEPLLEWLRHNAPDLRVGFALVDGERRVFARFTFGGQIYELEAADELGLFRDAVDRVRMAMNLPPLTGPTDRDASEREIVIAALSGHPEQADALGRELVMRNAREPRALYGRTSFQR